MHRLPVNALLISALFVSHSTSVFASENTEMAAEKGQVLVLLSSESAMTLADGSQYQTGYYLNEFGVPADALLKAGYQLVIATPKGNAPRVDQNSVLPMYFDGSKQEMQRIEKVVNQLDGLRDPLSFDQLLQGGLQTYQAVFIPGGHAPLIDLANNPQVGEILRHFHQAKKPTAAICHGPIALLSAQAQPQEYLTAMVNGESQAAKQWIYQDYKMTIFSTPEEQVFEQSLGGKSLTYYPADAMKKAGGAMDYAEKWQPHVVVDRELITGQNPFSDDELAKQLLKALNAQTKQ
ncbi:MULTISPECIES: type 1 glutamine amidotransferase domain-containing protein [unclassified Vibrio]|uniref:Type 1 glutamine amidotransferase domain-containing protein n=1 Tax=Vibrio sp. HB236076 TaxID=3232307 RepID=A0AB39HBB4_9VIBR|nr:type 1 glutamine amidotransferase domain-containing protein [Vibrio sp. HB161653]MDP5254424.1 type 1 glutamine amidotransferase domain-containing protein [Vibrio sp. HB161653]